MPLTIGIVNKSNNPLPKYATIGSSGLDIRANIEAEILLYPLKRTLVGTGLFLNMPSGIEAQIRSRSGLAINYGIACLNSPGTIDADFRGEIKVILFNLSDNVFIIKPNARIAQMVFQKIEQISLTQVEYLDETSRGENGFGSTGII